MKKAYRLFVTIGLVSLLLSGCGITINHSSGSTSSSQSNQPSSSSSSSEIKKYTITWKNYDGSVLEVDENVLEGITPTYDGLTPVKASDAQYSYTFKGWTPEVAAVNGDATYTATYQEEIRKYTVTWKNYDGTVLKTDENVPYGTTPSYSGEDPTKGSTAQYDYTFDGWTPEINAVSDNVTYTATFKEQIRKYTITWKNHDDSIIKTEEVTYGETPVYTGDEPIKASDAAHDYHFTGWTPSIVPVEGEATYTAVFEEQIRQYTITWKNHDGSLIKTEQVNYGDTPTYTGDIPTKDSTAKFAYVFDGWSPELVPVTGPAEYTATFHEEIRTYTITWKNYDDTVLEVDENVPYGTTPTYDGTRPYKPGLRGVTYTWRGWSPMVVPTGGDQTYTAVFSMKEDFCFDVFEYDTKNGYTIDDLQGAPWINSNLQGELQKINKPSLKDDFYASVNYEKILNHQPGAFDICDNYVNDALASLYTSANTTNSVFFRAFYNKVTSGDTNGIKTVINNIDVNEYLSSKEIFSSYSSFLNLVPRENGYEVEYNDGITNGKYGLQSYWFYGYYAQWTSSYEIYNTNGNNIVDKLGKALGFSISSSNKSSMRSIEGSMSYSAYNNYYYNYGNQVSNYTINTLPWSQMKSALLDLGLSSNTKIVVKKAYNNSLNSLFNNYPTSKAQELKNAIMTRYAFDNRFVLGANNYRQLCSYIDAGGFFEQESGLSSADNTTLAKRLTVAALPIIYEQSYIELEGTEEMKVTISSLIEDILAGYKQLVGGLDWLSAEAKQKVSTKLDYMDYASCYSDEIRNFKKVNDANLSTTSLSGLYQRYNTAVVESAIEKNVDTTGYWDSMPSYTVNAFYSPYQNVFVIMNAIVRGLVSDNIAETYGMIGVVIGHEITHAFDSHGSLFNESGEYDDNWLPEDDRYAFDVKLDKMISFLNKINLYDEVMEDGNNTNGETTADMGGVKVMLTLAKEIEDFDYDAFFRAYADVWCSYPYPYSYLPQRVTDEHPLNYLRTNLTLAQFDEFVETYDIKPGDGMYITESQRIKIW